MANVPKADVLITQATFRHVQSNKTFYIVIDEAHLLDIAISRKLSGSRGSTTWCCWATRN